MRELEDLKYGDKITISYSYDLYTAKVLDNFPDDEKILLKMRVGWFMSITQLFEYKSRNLELFRLKSYKDK